MNKRQGQPITDAEKEIMYEMYPTLAHLPSDRQRFRKIARRIGCNFTTVQKHIAAWRRVAA